MTIWSTWHRLILESESGGCGTIPGSSSPQDTEPQIVLENFASTVWMKYVCDRQTFYSNLKS